jgi:hypothetical protein
MAPVLMRVEMRVPTLWEHRWLEAGRQYDLPADMARNLIRSGHAVTGAMVAPETKAS